VYHLKMGSIKLKIKDRLVRAGYEPEQVSSYVKWSRGCGDCAWIAEHVIRTNRNSIASAIVWSIAGAPSTDVTKAQQAKYDTWYTD
jgi:hypothetical protein